VELPVVQPAVRRRADAVRNRERILCTARQLMDERGPDAVSMDCVAAHANVGKGTLYRAFGDRAGLLRALIEEDERRLQDELIRGLPPLGPGAPAGERLHAFGDAMLILLDDFAPLVAEAERKGEGGGPYPFYRTHVGLLLREALPADAPVDYLADTVMSVLRGDHVLRQRQMLGMSLDELRRGWHTLVAAMLGESTPR